MLCMPTHLPQPQPHAAHASSSSVQNKPHPQAKLPTFPPPLDSEVKYDIRSARGGRGGKVTSVANLWASGAIPGLAGSGGSGNGNANGVGRAEFGRLNKDGAIGQGKRLSAVEEGKVSSAASSVGVGGSGGVVGGAGAGVGGVRGQATTKPPAAAAKPEKKLFSAAVMTPAPARGTGPAPGASKPPAAPLRPKPTPTHQGQ
ncbi:hypothetical protein NLJ89_g12216 [Agrocybe chaxingu]|uniref:Uncharacterized protein n=1 Tax=Agrocybe chaxingu TaxID=84603 RepID=A0A9W8JMX3_9AGAR|nr:hypothetical protein NLJ89_g12216 [Agrocybe chaxingu]